jgi:hypothetical protein
MGILIVFSKYFLGSVVGEPGKLKMGYRLQNKICKNTGLGGSKTSHAYY